MIKKYSRKYIGKEFKTSKGSSALVTDGSSKPGYCTINVNGWIAEVHVRYLKTSNVKCPYDPSAYGVGYFGEGKYKANVNGKSTKPYSTWNNMLKRCYNHKFQINRPTYIGCSVDSSWHNYQVFAEWFEGNYVKGFHLDKDLLSECNKIYSKETCVFIPHLLNSFLANKYNNCNTSGYTGVILDKKTGKWVAQINDVDSHKPVYLGIYSTRLKASTAYNIARGGMADRMRIILITKYNITNKKILDNIK